MADKHWRKFTRTELEPIFQIDGNRIFERIYHVKLREIMFYGQYETLDDVVNAGMAEWQKLYSVGRKTANAIVIILENLAKEFGEEPPIVSKDFFDFWTAKKYAKSEATLKKMADLDAKRGQVYELRSQNKTWYAIAREMGINTMQAKQWAKRYRKDHNLPFPIENDKLYHLIEVANEKYRDLAEDMWILSRVLRERGYGEISVMLEHRLEHGRLDKPYEKEEVNVKSA